MTVRTEIACTECGTRRQFTGAYALAGFVEARAAGWKVVARQFPGRHTVWMRCPQCSKDTHPSQDAGGLP